MKFLTKLGAIILRGVEIVSGFAPMVAQSLPGSAGTVQIVSKDLSEVAAIIQDVEVMGQALNQAGPDKLKAAAPLVAQIILQSAILANHQIENAGLFNQGCTEIASGMADILNSLKADIQTVSKT